MLAEIQGRALSSSPSTVVLVEGLSDWVALETLAARCGRNLSANRVEIVGGATNLRRYLELVAPQRQDLRLAALCDDKEQEHFQPQPQERGPGTERRPVCHGVPRFLRVRARSRGGARPGLGRRRGRGNHRACRRPALTARTAADAVPSRSSARGTASPLYGRATRPQVPLRTGTHRGQAPVDGRGCRPPLLEGTDVGLDLRRCGGQDVESDVDGPL